MSFITKAYSESKNFKLELEYANSLRKKLVVLMIEDIQFNNIDTIRLIIEYIYRNVFLNIIV